MSTPTVSGQIRPTSISRLSHVQFGYSIPIDTDRPNETDLIYLHLIHSKMYLEEVILNDPHKRTNAKAALELTIQSLNLVKKWVKS